MAMETIIGKPLTAFTPKECDVLFNVSNKTHEDEVALARQVLREVKWPLKLRAGDTKELMRCIDRQGGRAGFVFQSMGSHANYLGK